MQTDEAKSGAGVNSPTATAPATTATTAELTPSQPTPSPDPASPHSPAATTWHQRLIGTEKRLYAIDLARGLALIGMFASHIAAVSKDFSWQMPWGWTGIVNGRSSVLFAVLAGVSLGILTGSTNPFTSRKLFQARLRIVGRAGFLLAWVSVLALVNMGVGLILGPYALWFILALPFLTWQPQKLFKLAAAISVLGPLLRWGYVWSIGLLPTAPAPLQPLAADHMFLGNIFAGAYPATAYMCFIFVGIGLSRLDLKSTRVAQKMLMAGVALMLAGYGTGAAINAWVTPVMTLDETAGVLAVRYGVADTAPGAPNISSPTADNGAASSIPENQGEAPSAANTPPANQESNTNVQRLTQDLDRALAVPWQFRPHTDGILDIWGSLGFSLALIALLTLAGRAAHVLAPIASMGAMSLTMYSLHIPFVGPANIVPDPVIRAWAFIGLTLLLIIFATLWRGLPRRPAKETQPGQAPKQPKPPVRRGPLESAIGKFSWRVAQLPPEPPTPTN